jgi:D-serine deaminase-like pyridoxal phosphate-dependent protein
MPDQGFPLDAAIEQLAQIKAQANRPMRVVIRRNNPGGMSGHQTTEVGGIHAGFDWEAGRVILEPVKPMTELTPEDVAAIRKSVAQGQSWHAYQLDNRRLAQLSEALGVQVTTFADAVECIKQLRASATAH